MAETCTSHGWWGYGIPCSPLLSLPSVGASGTKAALRNPFRAYTCEWWSTRMPASREPFAEVLTEVDISRQIHPFACLHPEYVLRWTPSGYDSPPKVLIVETHSQTVAGEKRCALIPRHAQHAVFGVEVGFLWRTAGMIAVIDFMASPVIEETQGGALFIMVSRASEVMPRVMRESLSMYGLPASPGLEA